MPEEKKSATNYASNSHKSKETAKEATPRPKMNKIIEGEAVERKKPLGRKIAETFTGDDVHSVGSYVLLDVVVPTIKTLISDVVSQGVERWMFGDSRPRSTGARGSYTSYNRPSSVVGSTRREEARPLSRRARANHDFAEVVLESRGEAEGVLESLQMLVDQYDIALVSDLYDLVGITGNFTDNKWGWTSLAGSGVRRVRDGYLVDLPPTESII